jgi:nitric-oxide synthase
MTRIDVDVRTEARGFLDLVAGETGEGPSAARLASIAAQVRRTGTYEHSARELQYGCMVAWRNNSHCIGRLHWRNLDVRDRRHVDTAAEIFDELVEHVRLATNGGRIRSTITVFAQQRPGEPGIRIWNPQLIRYAGYRRQDGSVVGDPLHAGLTDAVRRLGWRGPGGPFDVLPLVIQMPGREPELFELPADAVLEVPISHPEHPWFADLGLRWHALPAISNMRLEIGGVSYTAAPFNGWYVGTEIGARNLSDVQRYDCLPEIARGLGLDTGSDRSLWKDRALVELNAAVLHSYRAQGVLMVDHHTAARQYMQHLKNEAEFQRASPGEWSWLVPPISGSTSPVFHRSFTDPVPRPNIFAQADPWEARHAIAV